MVLIPPLNQHLQPIFQHKVTGARILANNITSNTPLRGYCDIFILLPLLRNLNLKYDTLLLLRNFNDYLTLSLTISINKSSEPILPDFHKVDPSTHMFDYLVPPEIITNHPHSYHNHFLLYQVLSKYIPDSINSSSAALDYEPPQHVITANDVLMML